MIEIAIMIITGATLTIVAIGTYHSYVITKELTQRRYEKLKKIYKEKEVSEICMFRFRNSNLSRRKQDDLLIKMWG